MTDNGFEVDWCNDTAVALKKIKTSEDLPYSLAIAVYMIPGMKGDETLRRIKTISPDTQRILIADPSDLERFVHGINSASIHACMAFPFTDEDLLSQVKLKCHDFKTGLKLKTLQNTILRQNEQLSKIAENFKKKKLLYENQTDKKEKEIRILESRLKYRFGPSGTKTNAELNDILTLQSVQLTPQAFQDAYTQLRQQINQVLEISFSKHKISLNFDIKPPDETNETTLSSGKGDQKKILSLLLNLIYYRESEKAKVYETINKTSLERLFNLTFSDNNHAAYLGLASGFKKTLSLSLFQVKRFLEKNRVIYGVVEDRIIEEWLYDEDERKSPLKIAQGKAPIFPRNAEVKYYFPLDFLHAGKVGFDGSIDFRDRGQIPCVMENALLASKKNAEPGEFGINVIGEKALVDDPVDPLFSAGHGARLSEDEKEIYSTVSGQPHRDYMGVVSVCPEHHINGDIDYKTGNIDFNGNVVVNGAVRQGFKVKCTSLTAKEINGAHIDISGDLNVSMGIVDTDLVNVKGSVQAKFIRNSKIHAFGDLRVQKEIIDSQIYLSGGCFNERGLIVNSKISAKLGITAGTIGNKISEASTLIVGIDEPVKRILEKIDSKLAVNQETLKQLNDQKMALEYENQNLHSVISQKAHVQDRTQLEIKAAEDQRISGERAGNSKVPGRDKKSIKALYKKAKEAEDAINKGFQRQDELSLELTGIQLTVKELEDSNKLCLKEKKGVLAFSSRNEPIPEIKVLKYIESKTRIFTPKASKTLTQHQYNCCIKQLISLSRGKKLHAIEISRS